jgi:hypothetical protein
MAWPSFPLVTTLLLRLIYGGLTLPAVTEYPVRVADTCAWDGFDAAVQRFSRVIQVRAPGAGHASASRSFSKLHLAQTPATAAPATAPALHKLSCRPLPAPAPHFPQRAAAATPPRLLLPPPRRAHHCY